MPACVTLLRASCYKFSSNIGQRNSLKQSCLLRRAFLYKTLETSTELSLVEFQEETLEPTDKKIVLARHGETTFNRAGFIMGRSDAPLTLEGISAAKHVARLVEEQKIRTVFSSPLGRARLSTEIYTGRMDLPILLREAMAELSCGEWEAKSRNEVLAGEELIRKTWLDRPPGGESYSDAESRVLPFIQEITSEEIQHPILVVGHAGVNRVFLKLWLSLDPECAIRINCPHDTVYQIENRQRVVAQSVNGLETEGFLFHADRFPSDEDRGCG